MAKIRFRNPKTPQTAPKKFRTIRKKYNTMKNIASLLLFIVVCQSVYILFNN